MKNPVQTKLIIIYVGLREIKLFRYLNMYCLNTILFVFFCFFQNVLSISGYLQEHLFFKIKVLFKCVFHWLSMCERLKHCWTQCTGILLIVELSKMRALLHSWLLMRRRGRLLGLWWVGGGLKSYILMSEYYYSPYYDRLGIASVTAIGLTITSMNGNRDVTCLYYIVTPWHNGCMFKIQGNREKFFRLDQFGERNEEFETYTLTSIAFLNKT